MAGLTNTYADDALRKPTYPVIPPYHPFRPEQRGLVDNAYGVIALPFPIEQHNRPKPGMTIPGPYIKGSSAWKETNPRFQHSEKFKTMLHLFGHALEFTNIGCPTFIGRPGSHPVREAQMAYLRMLEGRPRKEDRAVLEGRGGEHGIRYTLSMDQRVAETLRAIAAGELNDMIPGRDTLAQSGDEDDLMDGMDVDLDDRRGGRRQRGGGRRGRRRGRGRDDEAEEDDGDGEGGGGGDNATPDEEMDMRIREVFEQVLGDSEGTLVIEKLQILVVHMTRPVIGDNGEMVVTKKKLANGDIEETTEMEDAGCVVFICIMDPLYSIGKALFNVIEMAEEHYRAVTGTGAQDGRLPRGGDGTGDNGSGGGGGGSGPGGRGKRWSPSANATRLSQFFPWITAPEHRDNALLGMSMEKYIDLVAFIRDEPSLLREDRQRYLSRGMSDPGTDGNPNKLHPINVFTPSYALEVMAAYGVEQDQCGMDRFRGADYLTEVDVAGLPRWFFPPDDTYHYLQEIWTWHRNGKAGLKYQYWPWISVPDSMLRLTAVRNESNALTLYEGAGETNVLARDYTELCLIPGRGVVAPLPDMPYDPHAMQRLSAIFQVATENRQVLAGIVAPRDPEANPLDYRAYCDAMAEMRGACLMRMQQILVPTAHVAPSFKLILTFMAQKVRKVGTFLPHYTMDPTLACPIVLPMDCFCQYMIREALYVRYFRFVAAEIRHWQITHHGSKDAYSLFGVDMHYSAIYYGLSQGGKSFFAKDATVKTTVDGTVSQMLESSNRAFNTHDDFTAAIVFKDEIDNIYVDAKAAEKDRSGMAERIKSMTTDHKATYRVLTFIDQANGRQRRVAEDIESLYHAVLICCTNKRVGKGDEAIASRFLNFAITRADVDLYEYLGINERLDDLDKQRNQDFVKMLQVKQCLLAITMALIDAGALPEPSMDVYDTLLSRMLAFMHQQGMNTSAVRGAQMTKRLARVYIILNAIINLYDRPGAKYAKRDFELWQLADLIPYLHCTKQIALFAITQTGEIYVHPLQAIVVKSAFSVSRFPYVKGKTIEQYFAEDLKRAIPWKKEHVGTPEAAINFNYIRLEGHYQDVVLKNLAEHSRPRIGTNEIDAELTTMSSQFITVKPVQLMSMGFFDTLQEGAIKTFMLPREEESKQIQVVVRDFKGAETYVAVEALRHYRDDLLVDAFLSCIHDQFRPQEFLLGMQLSGPHPTKKDSPDHMYTGIYQTLAVTPVTVRVYSMGPKFLVGDVTYLPYAINEMFAGGRLDPDRKKEKYEAKRTKRNKAVIDIDEDLDDWGQKAHHYRVGCHGVPEDSPGRQSSIYTEVRRALLKLEKKHAAVEMHNTAHAADPSKHITVTNERSLLMDYPKELQEAEDARLRAVARTKDFEALGAKKHTIHMAQKAAHSKLPKAQRDKLQAPTEICAADFKSGGRFSVYTRKQDDLLQLLPQQQSAAHGSVMSDALVVVTAVDAEQQQVANEGLSNFAKEKRRARAAKAVPECEPTAHLYGVAGRPLATLAAPPDPPAAAASQAKRMRSSDGISYMDLDGENANDGSAASGAAASVEFAAVSAGRQTSSSMDATAHSQQQQQQQKKAKGQKKHVARSSSSALVLETSMSGFGDD